MRVWIPATWLDYTAFALVLIGIVGMVAHFWIQDYASMAWSAADHIAWHCSVCGDNGFIHGWEDTLWNRQGGECAESSETPPTTSH